MSYLFKICNLSGILLKIGKYYQEFFPKLDEHSSGTLSKLEEHLSETLSKIR